MKKMMLWIQETEINFLQSVIVVRVKSLDNREELNLESLFLCIEKAQMRCLRHLDITEITNKMWLVHDWSAPVSYLKHWGFKLMKLYNSFVLIGCLTNGFGQQYPVCLALQLMCLVQLIVHFSHYWTNLTRSLYLADLYTTMTNAAHLPRNV